MIYKHTKYLVTTYLQDMNMDNINHAVISESIGYKHADEQIIQHY